MVSRPASWTMLLLSPRPPSEGVAVAGRSVRKVCPGGHQALGGVSLEARSGAVLASFGQGGSGKTTLLKLVTRRSDPTSGGILVGDRPTTAWDPIELR